MLPSVGVQVVPRPCGQGMVRRRARRAKILKPYCACTRTVPFSAHCSFLIAVRLPTRQDAASNVGDAAKKAVGADEKKTRSPGEVATDAKDKVGDMAEDASRGVRDASKDVKRST